MKIMHHFLATIIPLVVLGQALALPAEKPIRKELSFPFFENEFQLPDNAFDLEFGHFKGELKISKTTVKGLNSLVITAEFDPKTGMTSSSLISDSEVAISGDYELFLSGVTPSGFALNVSGNGSQSNSVKNLRIGHEALLKDGPNGYVEVSDLKITIAFDSISLYFDDIVINGFGINWIWKPLNRFLNEDFSEILQEIQSPLTKALSKRLDDYFKVENLSLEQLAGILRGEA